MSAILGEPFAAGTFTAPAKPQQQEATKPLDPMHALIMHWIQTQQQAQQPQGNNIADLAALLKPTPGVHLDMSGNPITGDQNPFSNGFFGAKPGTPEFSGRTTPLDMSAASKAPALGNQWATNVAGAVGASQQNPFAAMMSAIPAQSPFIDTTIRQTPQTPIAANPNLSEESFLRLLGASAKKPKAMTLR